MALTPGSVWLDARGTQSAAHGERGVARYVAEQARALVDLAPELVGSIGLDAGTPTPRSMEPLVGSGLLAWHRRTRAPDRPVPSIYHVMSPFEVTLDLDDIWPAWIREAGSRLVVTLYDLIPMVLRDRYLTEWGHDGVVWMARLGLIRSAHQVLTISQHTANDAMEHLGIPEERITVVDSGVSGVHSSLVSSREEAERILQSSLPKIRPGFLLYVGGDDYRKNMEGTFRAYAELPQSVRDAHQLVVAFRVGPLRRLEHQAFAQSLGIRQRDLVLTGFVTDDQLAALYRSCELFVFPSIYEGAGLPILEAMSCGAPVAASNTTSIPELLGDLEATFDPTDPADMARCLLEVLGRPDRLEALRRRSEERVRIYTWERVARRTIEGYERAERVDLDAERRHRSRPKRKRLAVVTPWPPQPSDAAEYSRALVAELASHAEVEVITAADENGMQFDRSLGQEVSLRTELEFEWLRGVRRYDRALFVLGASQFHLHAFEQLLRVPGVVLSHDVRLLPLYRDLQRHRHPFDPHWLENKLSEMYGGRIPSDELRRIPYEGALADDRVAMSAEVQTHAERLLVHSSYQAELLRLDRPSGAAASEVIPFAIPDDVPEAPREVGPPVVVADADDASRPELRAALGLLSATHPGVRLEVVGSDRERPRPDLGRAALGVHLGREADGGRPSPFVANLIAARVPTIVSDVGWQGELPDEVVIPIPAELTAHSLEEAIRPLLDDQQRRRSIRAAQHDFAERNSFARVGERLAELLAL